MPCAPEPDAAIDPLLVKELRDAVTALDEVPECVGGTHDEYVEVAPPKRPGGVLRSYSAACLLAVMGGVTSGAWIVLAGILVLLIGLWSIIMEWNQS